MSASAEKAVIAKEGMRVHVFSPNQKDNCTIVKVEAEGYPKEIQLDSGRVVEGLECWWHPINKELILVLVKGVMAKRWKVAPARVGDESVCKIPEYVFRRIVEEVFGAENVQVIILEPLSASELTDMIWQYVV